MKWISVFVLLVFISSAVWAQFNALETTADARTIALGQSTVADILSSMSAISNPATLIGVQGTDFFYQERKIDYFDFLQDYRLRAGGVALKTSVGSFSFSYRRFEKGEGIITVIDRTTPQGYLDIGKARIFDYVGALSYAINIFKPITFGVTGKLYNSGYDWIEGGSFNEETTPAYLFDIGILFHFPVLFSSSPITDQLQIGTLLENFGTDMKTSSIVSGEYSYRPPRYWRIGFSWSLAAKKEIGNEVLHIVLNGEYHKRLNPSQPEERETDFWGVGMELQLFTIVALRVGGEIQPYENIFGKAEEMNLRYGVGVRLSPSQFGYSFPLSASFDFAIIPLNDHIFWFEPLKRDQLTVFTISLSYELSLF